MIPADQFLTALRSKLPHQKTLERFCLNEFLHDLEMHRLYAPGDVEVDIVQLISDPQRMFEAFYFVTLLEKNGRPQRISASGAFPGSLTPYELNYIQRFVFGLRSDLSSNIMLDPDTLIIPRSAPAMIVMTTIWNGQKSHEHEYYLLLHHALDPLVGIQLLYDSLMHWHAVLPADPTFFGEFTIQ